MKDISEYSEHDCDMVKEQACKMAMATIHKIYEEYHDETSLPYEELHKVKKAVQIICLLKTK